MAPQSLLDADANGAGAGGIGNLDHVVVTTIPPADEFNIPVWFDTHLGVRIAVSYTHLTLPTNREV